jgi:hypothetical protein
MISASKPCEDTILFALLFLENVSSS